jgi:hypothetical protein
VPRRGETHEGGIGLDEQPAEVALPHEELGGEVADVADLHLARRDAGRRERALRGLAHQVREGPPLAGDVAGEVGLEAAEDEDRRRARVCMARGYAGRSACAQGVPGLKMMG